MDFQKWSVTPPVSWFCVLSTKINSKKVAIDRIRTLVSWHWKRPWCQLYRNHGPNAAYGRSCFSKSCATYGRGGGQVVSVLVFYSDVPTSNPAPLIYEIFLLKSLLKRAKENRKRSWLGHSKHVAHALVTFIYFCGLLFPFWALMFCFTLFGLRQMFYTPKTIRIPDESQE